MTEAKKPGIIGMKYNKSLRLFETTLINGEKGPDISVDAIIAKDSSVETFKSGFNNIISKSNSVKSQFDIAKKASDTTKTNYNEAITQMIKIVDDIEGMVTK